MTLAKQQLAENCGAIRDWLRKQKEAMAGMLVELVTIATENPPGKNYAACADLLERQLRAVDLPSERIEASNTGERNNDGAVTLFSEYGRGAKTLYFHGHYDVVPAQSPEQFCPVQKGHFLFGRGSCDMKGGIVAMVYAILALRECGTKLGGKIALTLVPDEETGGARGSARMAAQGRLGRHGIGVLLAEPTSGVVWNANRGAITIRVRVKGKPAHVGLQHQGENAFERMVEVVRRLQDLKREVEQRATSCNIGVGQSPRSILLLGGATGGGTNFNVVPEESWFTLDRRINPEEDLNAEKSRLVATLEKCKSDGIPLEWEVFQEGASSACGEEQTLGLALARSAESVTGEVPRFEMCPGLLETRYYAAAGVPALAYGPGLLAVAHGPNEYVDMRRVVDCAAIYALTAMDVLS